MDCVFCKIIKGELPSYRVYEDEDILTVLDINPVSRGHCLVIPKKHFENIFDIDDIILQKIISGAKLISKKLAKSLKADGINLLQANGEKAGQVVFHFHLHVVPRYNNDGLNFHPASRQEPTLEELKKLAEKISSND